MILPVIYAVLTWFLAAKFRRRWQGALAVTLALGLLVLIGSTALEHEHGWLGMWRGGAAEMPEWWRSGSKQLLVLLIPYTALVGTVGVFLVCLPRPINQRTCSKCGYDLAGLNPLGLVCPECGSVQGPYRCKGCNHDLRGLNPLGLNCPECGQPWKGRGSGRENDPEPLTPILRKPPVKRRVNL